MNTTTVTTPNSWNPRRAGLRRAAAHVFAVWTDPALIPEWWGDGTVVEQMDVRPAGTYRFRTPFGVVEGEFREVGATRSCRRSNHLQTLQFEDLGDRTKLTQTMRFATTEERDTTMQYGVEEGAKAGFAQIDALLTRLQARAGWSTQQSIEEAPSGCRVHPLHDRRRARRRSSKRIGAQAKH